MFRKRSTKQIVQSTIAGEPPAAKENLPAEEAKETKIKRNRSNSPTSIPNEDAGRTSDEAKTTMTQSGDTTDLFPLEKTEGFSQSKVEKTTQDWYGGRTLICKPFRDHGTCRYGDACKYAHVVDDEGGVRKKKGLEDEREAWLSLTTTFQRSKQKSASKAQNGHESSDHRIHD